MFLLTECKEVFVKALKPVTSCALFPTASGFIFHSKGGFAVLWPSCLTVSVFSPTNYFLLEFLHRVTNHRRLPSTM